MKSRQGAVELFSGRLIVSCQASEGDPFRDSLSMARFARAAVDAGAAGIRANGREDVAAIREAVDVPLIGIDKQTHPDGRILITPTFEGARELAGAGADMIALDCTSRGQAYGAVERIRRIRSELGVPVLADIATLEEGKQAAAAGADFILTTLRGYTPETAHVREFDLDFLRDLVRAVSVPVIAEGRVATPGQAASALAAGALAVIVGGAITRPGEITRRFVCAMERQRRSRSAVYAVGIDLGGTNTKFAIAGQDGRLSFEGSVPTPAYSGKDGLLAHLKSVAGGLLKPAENAGTRVSAVGIATAGWVDPVEGRVVYATGNLPGWTGAGIRRELEQALRLPVSVENDANALAIGEHAFGVASGVGDFVSITLGTGVGGGCYIGGKLNRGAHYLANGLGHIPLEEDGLPCTCGRRGCLEVYANAAALVRYGGARFASAEAVMQSAAAGDSIARAAVGTYAGYLARGCSILAHLLDPDLIVLAGGIAQGSGILVSELVRMLEPRVSAFEQRRLRVAVSSLGNFGGVLGAAALALETAG